MMLNKNSGEDLQKMKTKHAVSIFRKFLGICMENCKIQGRSYSFPVTKTRDRAGWHQTGELPTGRRIYENSFPGVRLNDDELAVADVLMHMKKYVETGEDFYPLREGLQDAYLNFVMEEALRSGEEKYTCKQSWAE